MTHSGELVVVASNPLRSSSISLSIHLCAFRDGDDVGRNMVLFALCLSHMS